MEGEGWVTLGQLPQTAEADDPEQRSQSDPEGGPDDPRSTSRTAPAPAQTIGMTTRVHPTSAASPTSTPWPTGPERTSPQPQGQQHARG